MPVLEDPSAYGYYREEGGGLMVGLFEPACAPWKIEGMPTDMPYIDLPPDWERMTPYLETAMSRVPITAEVGMKKFFCGPESFTPDLKPIVGEAPELRGYFVAAGLNSIGILTGGGLGRVMAHWIINGLPDVDVTGMNIDRVLPYQANPDYRRSRTVESLGMVYKCHYPTHSLQTARGARRSPFHDRLAAQGAYFIETSGWETPGVVCGPGAVAEPGPHTWARPTWWSRWAAEHRAARENVVVMDMSFMGKFLVQGRDAGMCMNRISANDVDGAAGVITYTQWLNTQGRLEADLTVTKLADDRFFVVVTDTMVRHAEAWMKRNIPDDAHAFVTDVSSGYGQLNVQGPRSRELLQTLTSTDLSNDAFPFRAAREIDIGYARVLCVRITYLGELGYELYIPAEQAVHVYEKVVEAGVKFGAVHAGLRALGSLRMEKGYRDFGHDLDNTDDPYETGLGFAIDLKKPGGFIGKEALARAQGKRCAAAAAGAGAGQGPRAANVSCGDRAARRHGRRLCARRLVRPHAGRRRWTRVDGAEAGCRRDLPEFRDVGGGDRRQTLSGHRVRTPAIRSEGGANPDVVHLVEKAIHRPPASSSSFRAASLAPISTRSSEVFFTLGNISSCSSLTWCFTYSESTLTFASYISPSGSTPSICAIRSLMLACSTAASGTSSWSFNAALTSG